MFEKVNPAHPDKVADRIAGAIVDIAYLAEENPKIAVEVLIGHGVCHIIAETSTQIDRRAVCKAVHRITKDNSIMVNFTCIPQDKHLADNQSDKIRCGDNGIFKGVPLREKDKAISDMAHYLYEKYDNQQVFLSAYKILQKFYLLTEEKYY